MDASPPPALPAAFWTRLHEILAPDDLPLVLEALSRPRRATLRVNTLRGEPSAVAAELRAAGLQLASVPWLPEGFVLGDEDGEALRRLQETSAHARGAVFVQGLASQLAAPCLEPLPGERILDMAAAPGGKTAHLAARMADQGRIVANDMSRPRAYRLRAVLQQQGVRCAEVTCRPGAWFGRQHPGAFDRVLLDAPCSAEARLRGVRPAAGDGDAPTGEPGRARGRRARAERRRKAGSAWSLPRIHRLAGIQQRLLEAALLAVRPGGVVLYATCTLAPEENEAVVDRVLRAHPGTAVLEELPIRPPGSRPGLAAFGPREFLADLTRTRRILPDATQDAFFLARLRRIGPD